MGVTQLSRLSPWWRLSLGLLLLAMILVRLVWMQLRTYRGQIDPKAYVSLVAFEKLAPVGILNFGRIPNGLQDLTHPDKSPLKALGSPIFRAFHSFVGSSENLNERFFIRNHQSLLMAIVFFMVMSIRITTRSWVGALVVGAVLMSRGRLLTAVGHISTDMVMMTFVSGFFMAASLFIRTASLLSFMFLLAILLTGAILDVAMAGLWIGLPMMLIGGYVLHLSPFKHRIRNFGLLRWHFDRRLLKSSSHPIAGILKWGRQLSPLLELTASRTPLSRHRDQRVDYLKGGLLSPLRVPFLMWCLAQRRWVLIVTSLASLAFLGILTGFMLQFYFGSIVPYEWITSGQLFEGNPFSVWILSGFELVGELFDLEDSMSLSTLGQLQEPSRWNLTHPLKASFLTQEGGGVGLLSWILQWLRFQMLALDFHLGLSLVLIIFCLAIVPSFGVSPFTEYCWTVTFAALGLMLFSLVSDLYDHAVIFEVARHAPQVLDISWKPRIVFFWLEPILLSLGMGGLYHLIAFWSQEDLRRQS